MSKSTVKIVVWKEDENYVSLCLNTLISSFGDTRKEAIASLKEALELHLEDENTKISKVLRPTISPLTLQNA